MCLGRALPLLKCPLFISFIHQGSHHQNDEQSKTQHIFLYCTSSEEWLRLAIERPRYVIHTDQLDEMPRGKLAVFLWCITARIWFLYVFDTFIC